MYFFQGEKHVELVLQKYGALSEDYSLGTFLKVCHRGVFWVITNSWQFKLKELSKCDTDTHTQCGIVCHIAENAKKDVSGYTLTFTLPIVYVYKATSWYICYVFYILVPCCLQNIKPFAYQ